MRNNGIGDFVFRYIDEEFFISIECVGTHLSYSINRSNKSQSHFDDFEEMINAKVFEEKTLSEIWKDIVILSIDGLDESEYDVSNSFNYIQWKRDQGELQWQHYIASDAWIFFYRLKFVLIPIVIFMLLSCLLPILNLTNWNFLFLSGIIAVMTLIFAGIVMLKNKISINYTVTDKRIKVFKGIYFETTYDNIKNIKLKRSIFKKDWGSIKLYVKKGLSINYHIINIPDVEHVYKIIKENLKR